jgi:hypothetical protein
VRFRHLVSDSALSCPNDFGNLSSGLNVRARCTYTDLSGLWKRPIKKCQNKILCQNTENCLSQVKSWQATFSSTNLLFQTTHTPRRMRCLVILRPANHRHTNQKCSRIQYASKGESANIDLVLIRQLQVHKIQDECSKPEDQRMPKSYCSNRQSGKIAHQIPLSGTKCSNCCRDAAMDRIFIRFFILIICCYPAADINLYVK